MNYSYKVLLIVLIVGGDYSLIAGKTALAEEMATDEGLEITGLVMDESKTKMGRDFFEVFNTHWREIAGIDYTIKVSEFPDGRRGGSSWYR